MLITHGTLITFDPANPLVEDGALRVDGELIAGLGATKDLVTAFPNDEILDAQGQWVLPGNICSHTHFYGMFARGMALRGEPPRNFVEILEKLWWRLDKALGREDIRYSALPALADAIRDGTTCLIDHHASPNAIEGSLDVIAESAKQAGVRVACAYEVTDRDGAERARAGIEENVRFARTCKANPHPLVASSFGLHASFTLSAQTLEQCVEAAAQSGTGFHIHVAEDVADQDDCLQKYGVRVVERLQRSRILGARTIAAHCVHVDGREMDILRATETNVTHQPRSNMNNAVGTQRSLELLKRGICLGLGNDGFSNNMFVEMKVAYLAHKQALADPRVMGADQVMQMAFTNNGRIARQFWARPLGQLATGANADIILADYRPPTPLNPENIPWHVIFGLDGSHVTTTICAGKVLMRERVLLTLDEREVAAKAREHAQAVWGRM